MNKALKVFGSLLVLLLIVGCSKEQDIFKSNIKTEFTTDIEVSEEIISEEDYKKYNDIMDYLYDHPEKTEAELFKELESVYDESASELEEFMNSNMQDAIAYDFEESRVEISDVEGIVEDFFDENLQDTSLLDMDFDRDPLTLDLTGLRAIISGEFLYDDNEFIYFMKMEFSDGFQEVNIFELNVNDVIIDLG